MMTHNEAIERIVDHIRVHHIGEYPHIKLKEALDLAIAHLRPVSREQMEKVWRGEWIHDPDTGYEHCDRCGHTICLDDYLNRKPPLFCEMCGEPKTDEAVEMVMRRLEALYEVAE